MEAFLEGGGGGIAFGVGASYLSKVGGIGIPLLGGLGVLD